MWGYVVSPLRCFKFSLGSLSWTELHIPPPTHTHTQLQLGEQVTFATCLEQLSIIIIYVQYGISKLAQELQC